MLDPDLFARIELRKGVMAGKPAIRGTRLTVEFIMKLLARGASEAEAFAECAGSEKDDIRACYLFAGKSLESTDFMPLAAVPS